MSIFLRTLVAATVALTLGGCATSGTQTAELDPSDGPILTTVDKVEAYNEGKADDDKLVCTKRPITGSHKKTVICRTVAQAREERQAAQETLQRGVGGFQKSVD